MTRWKKNVTEFAVAVHTICNQSESTTQICTIPKPIIEFLKNPQRIQFIIKNNKVEITKVNT